MLSGNNSSAGKSQNIERKSSRRSRSQNPNIV